MNPVFNFSENVVLAPCPDCQAITSFDNKGHSETRLGVPIVNWRHEYDNRTYSRVLWYAFRCSVCSRGAFAKVHDNGSTQTAVLEEFTPGAVIRTALPSSIPDDIEKEFREAEVDAAHGCFRSASAMLRSTLEKTLTKNGYSEVEIKDKAGNPRKSNRLIDRIDAAAADGVITETRQKRAHENIRVLGNDVLHEPWRAVLKEEYEAAHKYTQRILEDFYDDRETVEGRLKSKGRL